MNEPAPAPDKISIIVKVTERCNLACKYCYQSARINSSLMKPDILQTLVANALQTSCQGVEFIWHGGEPLLAGTKFFQRALDLQKELGNGKVVLNSIQSNLTLLDEGIADFLRNNKFRIGTSIDGTEALHNIHRVHPDSSGTFQDVVSSIRTLRKVGAHVAAICVVTKTNVSELKDIYALFNSLEVDFRMNPLMPDAESELILPSPDEYGKMLVGMFDLWTEDEHSNCEIGNFVEILQSFLLGRANHCIFTKCCFGNFLSVDSRGYIFPCDVFCDNKEFALGHVSTDSIEAVRRGGKISNFRDSRLRGIEDDCHSCEHLSLCWGGCPYNALLGQNDITKKDYYCSSYHMLFDHIERWLAKVQCMPNPIGNMGS